MINKVSAIVQVVNYIIVYLEKSRFGRMESFICTLHYDYRNMVEEHIFNNILLTSKYEDVEDWLFYQ